MRYKVLFLLALVALMGFVGCSKTTDTVSTDPSTTTVVTDGGTTTTTTTTDPKTGIKTVLKKSIVKTPLFYGGASSGRSVVVTQGNWSEALWIGLGPVLIKDWSTADTLATGVTFTKSLYGNDVSFNTTVDSTTTETSEDSVDENGEPIVVKTTTVTVNKVTYDGTLSDNAGTVTVVYYPATKTFDLSYKAIFEYQNAQQITHDMYPDIDSSVYQGFYGKMVGASITDTGYTGDFEVYSYCSTLGMGHVRDMANIRAYKFHMTGASGVVTAKGYGKIGIVHVSTDPSTVIFPSIVSPLAYNSVFWDEMLQLDSNTTDWCVPNETYTY